MADKINLVSHERFKEGLKGVYDKTKEKISDLKLRTHVGKELDYGEFAANLESTTASATQYIVATDNSYGNLLKTDDGTITLKRGTSYKISFTGSIHCSEITYVTLSLCNINGTPLRIMSCPRTMTYVNNETECGEHSCFYKATEDINIKIRVVSNVGTISNCYSGKITIEEIHREVLINEVEEVAKSKHIEDTPVGHIMSIMGLTSPVHYLICDGSEYNIEDYPKLAEYFQTQFGSINYFGGDGINTFAVPNISDNRYLKGSNTDIGISEEEGLPDLTGTISNDLFITNGGTPTGVFKDTTSSKTNNYGSSGYGNSGKTDFKASNSNSIYGNSGHVTPKNISVLFCIKYEPTYFMNYSPQYAGFDTTVLFEGEAKDSGKEYLLNDKVENYDYLDVYCTLREKTTKELLCGSYIKVNCENIKKGFVKHELSISNDVVPWRHNIEIKESSFIVTINSMPNNVYDMFVYSIMGVKSGSTSLINKEVSDEMISSDISDIFSEVMNK